MHKNLYNTIKTVMVSEKATDLMDAHNQYSFKVAKDSNKKEIKRAVEKLFSVGVQSVRTMNCRGKLKRMRGQFPGRTASWKKAIVTLNANDSIELY
ncbi:MAG: 50S ribosomal protein L23 [Verrucomicrobiota bacterium]|nr:50S ribosomal protein L23 [Verrucomicrobiota bacterium]